MPHQAQRLFLRCCLDFQEAHDGVHEWSKLSSNLPELNIAHQFLLTA